MSPENNCSIKQNLANWRNSLSQKIPLAGLLSRAPIVYKWKGPMRCWMLREAIFWRLHDLMTQSYSLYQQEYMLGARILLRSGFETLATLIYLNQLTQQVLDGKLSFHTWGEKTTTLLFGSRNNSEMPKSINIITVLEKCDKRYPGLKKLYADLSESAHPSYEGLLGGYSEIDQSEYETIFVNRWMARYGERHLSLMDRCMRTFHHEYDEVWCQLMEKLEGWIKVNDAKLEADRNSS